MRVVLDTNVLLSILVFRDARFAPVCEALAARRIVPLADDDCLGELARVLAYPQFAARYAGPAAALAEYLPYVERVDPAAPDAHRLPECRDPDDQKFLVLAANGGADALVTSDALLLALRRRVPFAIETPKTFLARFAPADAAPSPA